MKKLIAILLSCFPLFAIAQHHQLEKIWQTDTIVAVPESVLPDFKKGILYISLIDGGGWDADGKGGVGKLDMDGKNYTGNWVSGLNAPKGLGRYGNRLYVADITNVVIIDIATGNVAKKIMVDSATALNDITVTDKGIVFVSDSRQGRIWRIENDVPSLYLDKVKGANGLKARGQDLIYAEGKLLKKANAQKQIIQIAEVPQGIDGIEPVGNGDYIVTAWAGYIFYVTANGQVETLLDSHTEKMNTADIGFDPIRRIVFVPTFNAKKIVAYRLK
ncbi:ATP-binding protein [Chitinophaga sp. CF118]|uniref:ATP-binding protein n=1 Tax=Chitinophaga sp. CF118 TaxID=1884367 RepID=UPI000B7C96AE|nr:ATP-binding protein [Chitinophaga sp. CF118]